MNYREKILLGVIAAVGVVYVARGYYVANVSEPLALKADEILRLTQEVGDKEVAVAEAVKKEEEYERWNAHALPARDSIANTGYQNFLRELIAAAGVDKPRIEPARKGTGRDAVRPMEFTVTMACSLEQLTQVLQRFYRVDLLHQVRAVTLTPKIDDRKITVYDCTLGIEALSLATAKYKEVPEVLAAVGPKEEFKADPTFELLVRKSPFQPTELVDEGPQLADKKDDARKHYRIYGLVTKEGEPELKINNTKTGERLTVAAGENLKVEGLDAEVVSISPVSLEATLRVDDKLGTVRIGGTLADWMQSEVQPTRSASQERDDKAQTL